MGIKAIYKVVTFPFVAIYRYLYIPVWNVCCSPGGVLYRLKEATIDCCRCCRSTSDGAYGTGVWFFCYHEYRGRDVCDVGWDPWRFPEGTRTRRKCGGGYLEGQNQRHRPPTFMFWAHPGLVQWRPGTRSLCEGHAQADLRCVDVRTGRKIQKRRCEMHRTRMSCIRRFDRFLRGCSWGSTATFVRSARLPPCWTAKR